MSHTDNESLHRCMLAALRNPITHLAISSLVFFGCANDRTVDDLDSGDGAGDESGNLDDGSETEVATDQPGSPPTFTAPVGEGAVVDLSVEPCVEVEVIVEDPDDDEVTITVDPELEGATLADAGASSIWTWCPTEAQAQEDMQVITFAADDGTYEPVLKTQVIRLRR